MDRSLLLTVFGMVFVAELGDKTQLLMIALASRYRVREIVPGVALAIVFLNAFAILAGVLLGGLLPTTLISLVAGAAFLYFAYAAFPLRGEDDREEGTGAESGRRGARAIFSVFGTFFLAELGDKTQLTALALAADQAAGGLDLGRALAVFTGASLALLTADLLGLAVGTLLGKRLPEAVFGWLSFGIFAVFGTVKLLRGWEAVFAAPGMPWKAIGCTVICVAALVAGCLNAARLRETRKRRERVL